MAKHFRPLIALLFGALLALGTTAFAQDADAPKDTPKEPAAKEETPFDIVKVNSEEVLAILRDNAKGDDAAKKRREAFVKKIADYFDWPAIAQHGLGIHWRARSDEEKAEFTALFRKLLEQVYYSRLQLHAVDATVNYIKDDIDAEAGRATVYTIAVKNARETPINYLMRKVELKEGEELTGPPWLIYDVKVEGVSLLLNYREQFNEIIVSGSFEKLMKRLAKKVEYNEKKLK